MDSPHRRVVTASTSCSKQAVMYIVLSPLACHTMCWHFPTDDVGNPYSPYGLPYARFHAGCHVRSRPRGRRHRPAELRGTGVSDEHLSPDATPRILNYPGTGWTA